MGFEHITFTTGISNHGLLTNIWTLKSACTDCKRNMIKVKTIGVSKYGKNLFVVLKVFLLSVYVNTNLIVK